MATVIDISKVSGVLFVKHGTQNPISYFGATGSYQFDDADAQVTVTIGTVTFVNRWGYITVNGQTPSTSTESKTLLNAIFGV